MQMDWIGLYKVMDEKAFFLARDLSERVGCSMCIAKFRPPHAFNAQVQLRCACTYLFADGHAFAYCFGILCALCCVPSATRLTAVIR